MPASGGAPVQGAALQHMGSRPRGPSRQTTIDSIGRSSSGEGLSGMIPPTIDENKGMSSEELHSLEYNSHANISTGPPPVVSTAAVPSPSSSKERHGGSARSQNFLAAIPEDQKAWTDPATGESTAKGLTRLPSDTFSDLSELKSHIQKLSEQQAALQKEKEQQTLKVNMTTPPNPALKDYPSNGSLGSFYSEGANSATGGKNGKKLQRLQSNQSARGRIRNRLLLDALAKIFCCSVCKRRRADPEGKNPLSNRV